MFSSVSISNRSNGAGDLYSWCQTQRNKMSSDSDQICQLVFLKSVSNPKEEKRCCVILTRLVNLPFLVPKLVLRAQKNWCRPILTRLGSLPDRELLALLRGWINCAKLRTINNLAEGCARDRRRRGAFVSSSWKRGSGSGVEWNGKRGMVSGGFASKISIGRVRGRRRAR